MDNETKIEELNKSVIILKEKSMREIQERNDLFEDISKCFGIKPTIYSIDDLKKKVKEIIVDWNQALNNEISFLKMCIEIKNELCSFEKTVTYWR